MNVIKLHKDFLRNELDLPSDAVKNTITGTRRWSIDHEIVFAYNNKYYMTGYSEGATEMQDEGPWEYDYGEIECVEVELVKVEKLEWKEVK